MRAAMPSTAARSVSCCSSTRPSAQGPAAWHGDPVERARHRMNYTNNWHRKEVDEGKQLTWQEPLKQDPVVAIIGGGLSGLACAHVSSKMPMPTNMLPVDDLHS